MTTRGRRRLGAHHGTLRGPVLPWAWAWAARSPGTGESFARGYQWDFSGGGRGVRADGAPTGARPRAKVSLQMRARRGRRPGGQCQLLRPPRPPLRPAGGPLWCPATPLSPVGQQGPSQWAVLRAQSAAGPGALCDRVTRWGGQCRPGVQGRRCRDHPQLHDPGC